MVGDEVMVGITIIHIVLCVFAGFYMRYVDATFDELKGRIKALEGDKK